MVHATKRFVNGQRGTLVLRDVSLHVGAGELVAVRGMRRSGRSTLLRIAAGILPPDAGEVRFGGRPLADCTQTLGVDIGWCSPRFDPAQGGTVADHVAVALLACGAGRARARARAEAALERAGALDCATLDAGELSAAERMRAGVARVLVTRPRLMLLDESAACASDRDGLPALLRSLADDDGLAVLMAAGEHVPCADRVLALEHGQLREQVAAGERGPVVPLRPRQVEPVA